MNLYDVQVIKPLLQKYGFHFSKALGQNFLIAGWVTKKMVECAGIDRNSGVLEIGPGIGVLTKELAEAAGVVVAVELDHKLIPLLHETLSGYDHITVLHQNIMKTDLREIAANYFKDTVPSVCANLPYQITSPVLSALIEANCFEKITVMIQKEVAQRICARPGTPEYGAFTVYVNYHMQPNPLFDVSPDCFLPRPSVTSSVILLTKKEKPDFVEDESEFFKTVRAAFAQRRKTLVNALFSVYGNRLAKPTLTQILLDKGFDEKIRGGKSRYF
jgi:16S rRNA (adenine1518-N6/adenine1519-N6)-dimethyltransferase